MLKFFFLGFAAGIASGTLGCKIKKSLDEKKDIETHEHELRTQLGPKAEKILEEGVQLKHDVENASQGWLSGLASGANKQMAQLDKVFKNETEPIKLLKGFPEPEEHSQPNRPEKDEESSEEKDPKRPDEEGSSEASGWLSGLFPGGSKESDHDKPLDTESEPMKQLHEPAEGRAHLLKQDKSSKEDDPKQPNDEGGSEVKDWFTGIFPGETKELDHPEQDQVTLEKESEPMKQPTGIAKRFVDTVLHHKESDHEKDVFKKQVSGADASREDKESCKEIDPKSSHGTQSWISIAFSGGSNDSDQCKKAVENESEITEQPAGDLQALITSKEEPSAEKDLMKPSDDVGKGWFSGLFSGGSHKPNQVDHDPKKESEPKKQFSGTPSRHAHESSRDEGKTSEENDSTNPSEDESSVSKGWLSGLFSGGNSESSQADKPSKKDESDKQFTGIQVGHISEASPVKDEDSSKDQDEEKPSQEDSSWFSRLFSRGGKVSNQIDLASEKESEPKKHHTGTSEGHDHQTSIVDKESCKKVCSELDEDEPSSWISGLFKHDGTKDAARDRKKSKKIKICGEFEIEEISQ